MNPAFKSLKSLGESFLSRQDYGQFAQYCLLRDQGLRKNALQAMGLFIAEMQLQPLARQREVAEELARLAYRHGDIHQLLPHPLTTFLTEIFEKWCAGQPALAAPYRWLGFLGGDTTHFRSALRVDAKDAVSLQELVRACLREVDYQTHHISESLFIGSAQDAENTLDEAKAYALRLDQDEAKQAFLERIAYFRHLLDAWNSYCAGDRTMGFNDWCRAKGLHFNFWSVVYYGAPY